MNTDMGASVSLAVIWLVVGVVYGFTYGLRKISRERRGREPVRLTYVGHHRSRP